MKLFQRFYYFWISTRVNNIRYNNIGLTDEVNYFVTPLSYAPIIGVVVGKHWFGGKFFRRCMKAPYKFHEFLSHMLGSLSGIFRNVIADGSQRTPGTSGKNNTISFQPLIQLFDSSISS